jgi:hypothetical protein
MAEHEVADREHLGQIRRAEFVAKPPEHHASDDIARVLHAVQKTAAPLIVARIAGVQQSAMTIPDRSYRVDHSRAGERPVHWSTTLSSSGRGRAVTAPCSSAVGLPMSSARILWAYGLELVRDELRDGDIGALDKADRSETHQFLRAHGRARTGFATSHHD